MNRCSQNTQQPETVAAGTDIGGPCPVTAAVLLLLYNLATTVVSIDKIVRVVTLVDVVIVGDRNIQYL